MNVTEMTVTRGNDQFYPTPPELAFKMLEGLDVDYVSSVLEPSAGKGDLVRAIVDKKRMRNRYGGNKLDVDCCEIDPYLRQILRYNFSDERLCEVDPSGTGRHIPEAEIIRHTDLHIVHDDFLTYRSGKQYDLILMNPPFADGDRHLLKALDMQKDGGLVICLLNAETLNNPYTPARQLLAKRLKDLDAEVRFVEDAFSSAERSARVDVAIVRVHIPFAKHESTIWERMKKAQEQEEHIPDPELEALVAGDYIDQAIQLYNTEVAACLELIREYRALVPYMQPSLSPGEKYGSGILVLKVAGEGQYDSLSVNRYMRAVRAKYWKALFKNEKFIGRLTSQLRERYQKTVDRMADYEFSAYNIRQVLVEMNAEMNQGVEDAIMSLFEKLTVEHSWFPECSTNKHYYNGWATNKAHKIGKKCIVPEDMFYHYCFRGSNDEIDTHKAYSVLSDLEKSFDYLGGETPEGYSLDACLQLAKDGGKTKNIQLKYFAIDIYKKGTTHIKFYPETMPLVERLNIYASQKKGWLPPRYGKASYGNMNRAEKEVVDSFHGDGKDGSGEKAYTEVLRKADFYLSEPTQRMPALMAAT